ncbi:hypothetical protein C8R47DRAFT_1259808 [Mycena vitilis]|nr:hypothetical protein C8R47DRAFT_1259808 [Mycena vitilis]
MHKSLELRTLKQLPPSSRYQKAALSAAQGSFAHLQQIMVHIVESGPPNAILYLPICWPNLDPTKIPTPHELDDLLANSKADDIPKFPFIALEMILFLRNIPPQALLDLWPRIWPWIQFLDTYSELMPTCPVLLHLYWVFFGYLDRVPNTLVNTTPGVRALIAKAWVEYVDNGSVESGGFSALLRFIGSDVPLSEACLVEYAAGVGDSVDHLAALVCSHFLMVRGHVSLGPIQMGIRFALAIGAGEASAAESEFQTCLRRRGVVAVLAEITRDFAEELRAFPQDVQLKVTVSDCLSLLVLELCHPAGYLWIPEAIRAGLLGTLACLAHVQAADDHILYIQLLLTEAHRSTAYYSVLREIEGCPSELSKRIPPDPILPQWVAFVALAKDRLELKKTFDSTDYVAYLACDNLLVLEFTVYTRLGPQLT